MRKQMRDGKAQYVPKWTHLGIPSVSQLFRITAKQVTSILHNFQLTPYLYIPYTT